MQNKDYPKLRECPHCGGEARLTKLNQKGFGGEFKVFVQCKKCKARTNVVYPMPHYSLEARKETAIRAWNRRTHDIGNPVTDSAIAWIEAELHVLQNAPKVNGCEMTEDWQKAIDALSVALVALQRCVPAAAKTSNEPLTLEELRQMDGEERK